MYLTHKDKTEINANYNIRTTQASISNSMKAMAICLRIQNESILKTRNHVCSALDEATLEPAQLTLLTSFHQFLNLHQSHKDSLASAQHFKII
jgi:hypothetical protein